MTHGKTSTYTNYGCRCDECREAHNAYMGRYKARRRKAGLCVDCKEKAAPGRTRCEPHLKAARRHSDTHKAKHLEDLTGLSR